MSSVVGCFGDCGFGPSEPPKPKNFSVVFHPPIQTILKEKDDAKWYTDMVNELETVGEDPNQFNEYGEAPLCVAAYKAQGMVVAELLQRENISVNIKGKHGRTPLYIAAEEGHVFIVKCLLAHRNIDVNIKNSPGGATALMGASRRGHSRIVELLLHHPGCNPDLLDRDGQTALQHARTNSVKWRLHNYTYRSRSVDNVMGAKRHNICHTSPPTADGPPDLPAEIPLSAPANFRHLSLQEFHTDKGEVETCARYKHFSSEESSRHSSSSSQQVREEGRDRDDDDDCEEGDEADEEVEHGDDDNIFEDNQPLLKCPETKEVLTEKKSKSDH